MELHNLSPAKGSIKSEKRIGRGIGSGKGRTSARGHKGAKSRSGYKSKRHFEGGQMPLQMRLPKRGFKPLNRTEYVPFNLTRLSEIADKFNESAITVEFLRSKRIIKKNDLVKILAGGELKSALTIGAHACSESAKAAVEKAGGSLNIA